MILIEEIKKYTKLLFLFLISILWGCNSNQTNSSATSNNASQTTIQQDSTDEENEISYDEALSDLEESYKTKIVIDSTFLIGGDNFRIKMNYYCTFDNGIEIPETYSYAENPEAIKTHNFIADIEIQKNGTSIFNNKIDKAFCAPDLGTKELKDYGVISYPSVKFKNNQLQIDFNCAIPFTDIGEYLEYYWDDKAKKFVYLAD